MERPCPICGRELVEIGNMSEDGRRQCLSECYCWTFAYGANEEVYAAGGLRLECCWDYHTSMADFIRMGRLVGEFVKYAKEVKNA